MKLKQVITDISNAGTILDEKNICRYLNDIEARIKKEVLDKYSSDNLSVHYSLPQDYDTEMLLQDEYEELYTSYVLAMSFCESGDIAAFNELAENFNKRFKLLMADYRKNNMPISNGLKYWS